MIRHFLHSFVKDEHIVGNKWPKMTRNGCKMAIYQLFFLRARAGPVRTKAGATHDKF